MCGAMVPLKCLVLVSICLISSAAAAPPRSPKGSPGGVEVKLNSLSSSLNREDVLNFFSKSWAKGVVAGGGAALLLVLGLVLLGCCCYCYKKRHCCFRNHGNRYGALERRPLISHYRSPDATYNSRHPGQVEVGMGRDGRRYERSVGEEFQRQKEQREQNDRGVARKSVVYHLRNSKHLEMVKELPDMGSRMLKFWFHIRDRRDRKEQLLTIAPVSQKCPLVLEEKTLRTINSLLRQLSHPNLHRTNSIAVSGEGDMVIITQPLVKGGSLKDVIYRSTPTSEWTMKYSRRCRGLAPAKVALYGRQILEGLRYLRNDCHFPPLGHVQTGNIFLDGDTCSLGGYENTLLGYKTRSYRVCKEHLDDIDLILFGHVVFEMSCGYELTELVADDQQYADVRDLRVKGVLEFIFSQNEDGTFAHNIEEVYQLDFFQGVQLPDHRGGGRIDRTELTQDMRHLLAKVVKNKARVQKVGKKRRRSGKSSSATGFTSPSDAESAARAKS